MRPLQEVELVASLLGEGHNAVEAGRIAEVPWRTIQKWRQAGIGDIVESRRRRAPCDPESCARITALPAGAYAYLLGQYLGDGSIAAFPRRVYRLEIASDLRYPGIIEEVREAMATVLPASLVGMRTKTGCAVISSYSQHWPCLFPQHGRGPKHERAITLASWQLDIAKAETPLLLRGLIHSDGCRVLNTVKGTPYPRYHFTNRSDDVREIFLWACGQLGVECRPNNRYNLSIARRASVALVDAFVGPKT